MMVLVIGLGMLSCSCDKLLSLKMFDFLCHMCMRNVISWLLDLFCVFIHYQLVIGLWYLWLLMWIWWCLCLCLCLLLFVFDP
ncbi:hypothetical protein Hdeb2414_s0079g00778971 [Helianthus debilis subsp. tardiflorus]